MWETTYNTLYMASTVNKTKTNVGNNLQHFVHGINCEYNKNKCGKQPTTLCTWHQLWIQQKQMWETTYNTLYMASTVNTTKTNVGNNLQHFVHGINCEYNKNKCGKQPTTLCTWHQLWIQQKQMWETTYNTLYMASTVNTTKTNVGNNLQHFVHGINCKYNKNKCGKQPTTLCTWHQLWIQQKQMWETTYNTLYMASTVNTITTNVGNNLQHFVHSNNCEYNNNKGGKQPTTLSN